MLLLPSFIQFSSKISAGATSSDSAIHVKVRSKKRMTFLAMKTILNREVHPSHGVDMASCNLNVVWVYASFVLAKMVTLKVFWDWTIEKFPSEAVRVFFTVVRDGIASIPFPVTSCSPNPATVIYGHFAFESLGQLTQANHAPVYHDIRKEAMIY